MMPRIQSPVSIKAPRQCLAWPLPVSPLTQAQATARPPLMCSGNAKVVAFVPLVPRLSSVPTFGGNTGEARMTGGGVCRPADGWDDWGFDPDWGLS